MTNQGELLSMQQCSEITGRSVYTLRELDRDGLFALGGAYGKSKLYKKADVQAWIDSYGTARSAEEYESHQAIERKRVGQ